jgi:hypothetical protein
MDDLGKVLIVVGVVFVILALALVEHVAGILHVSLGVAFNFLIFSILVVVVSYAAGKLFGAKESLMVFLAGFWASFWPVIHVWAHPALPWEGVGVPHWLGSIWAFPVGVIAFGAAGYYAAKLLE